MRRPLAPLLALALLASGCLAGAHRADPSDVRLSLSPAREVLAPGETATLTLAFEVLRPTTYRSPGCPSGLQVEVHLADGRRLPLHPLGPDGRPEEPPATACMVQDLTLRPGMTLLRYAWDGRDRDGAPVPPGEHAVVARLAAHDLDVSANSRVLMLGGGAAN